MIKTVILGALLGLASAKECQYFLGDFFGDDVAAPLGIDHCSYWVHNEQEYSFTITCLSTTVAQMKHYSNKIDCAGDHETYTYTSDNATFDCSTEKLTCGKAFGYKTPCVCTAEGGDCDSAVSVALVDELCVSDYYKWMITCGSISKANAVYNIYTGSGCTGSGSASTFQAGCQESTAYQEISNTTSDELDWIICPGNMATMSFSVLVGLIVAALAL